jgi:hypothetical protein
MLVLLALSSLSLTFDSQLYTTALAVLALVATEKCRQLADIHLGLLFLAFFVYYSYKDLVPFALVDGKNIGPIGTTRLVVLALLGIVIPLCMPGRPSSVSLSVK